MAGVGGRIRWVARAVGLGGEDRFDLRNVLPVDKSVSIRQIIGLPLIVSGGGWDSANPVCIHWLSALDPRFEHGYYGGLSAKAGFLLTDRSTAL